MNPKVGSIFEVLSDCPQRIYGQVYRGRPPGHRKLQGLILVVDWRRLQVPLLLVQFVVGGHLARAVLVLFMQQKDARYNPDLGLTGDQQAHHSLKRLFPGPQHLVQLTSKHLKKNH